MYIDFNQIARIGKFVALLGFFLPWVTVSCSGADILQATGWQLMTGDPQPVGAFARAAEEQQQERDFEPAVVIIAAFAVIIIGLGTSLVTRTQTAAISMLVCAVLGIGITYYGVQNLQTELRQEISNQSGSLEPASNYPSGGLSELVASEIEVNEQEGYVVTHSGLLLAAIFSLLTLFRKRQPGAETPPASTS